MVPMVDITDGELLEVNAAWGTLKFTGRFAEEPLVETTPALVPLELVDPAEPMYVLTGVPSSTRER